MKRFCRVLIICFVITIFAHHGYAMDLEQMKKTFKNEVSKIGEKLLKDQTVQDLYLLATSKEVREVQVGERKLLLPFPLTKEGLEIQKKFIIKAVETAIDVACDGCFSLDLDLLDASQLAQRTAQQLLTPVKVEFRQEYDLLFTQSADSLGSRYGSHSGTITDGTRFNISGDSRAGDFTGSITNGRTVAEPGYTPATHNNTPGSGTSVGTVSAKGFKEGELKGNMTITIPAGVQAVTVSGNITISKDGSLSMPSYSGPVTDNATGAKVGTMTGTWNQGPTR